MLDRAKLVSTVQLVMELLVAGKYEEIERLTKGIRLSQNELRQSIEKLGLSLVTPPPSVFAALEVIEVDDTPPQKWCTGIDLYTPDGIPSDLTLELTLTDCCGSY